MLDISKIYGNNTKYMTQDNDKVYQKISELCYSFVYTDDYVLLTSQ